jgi:flavin-dependent dehydrogenase
MEAAGVLIVGGGPAGSTCAWALAQLGVEALLVDRARFPRDKVCGGWVTPQVVEELELDLQDYARSRVLQPITGFRVGGIGEAAREIRYERPVSYGIRRCEFDEYLLRRSGVRVREGFDMRELTRERGQWLVNGEIRTPMLVGAGGHFCPVARRLPQGSDRGAVLAQEIEFRMTPEQAAACGVSAETPELYFSRDLLGYGWCIRKGDFLNVGLGRLDKGLPAHVRDFVGFLERAGRIGFSLAEHFPGHAYYLYGYSPRPLHAGGVVLIGDAAGLAYAQSGEGIRTAVESGLLAAETIAAARGDYSLGRLAAYADRIRDRFGESGRTTALLHHLPSRMRAALGRWLLRREWFLRDVVLDDFFLHAGTSPLKLARHRSPEAALAS